MTWGIYPKVAMDGANNAIAVWPLNGDIWANRYDATTGSWGATLTLLEENNGSVSTPQIAMDQTGNAVVVWPQWDGTRYSIYANVFRR